MTTGRLPAKRPHPAPAAAAYYGPTLEAALDAAAQCDLFFSIGTSALVQPAAFLPFEALRYHAAVVEINPDETSFTPHATHSLRGPAGRVLPTLLQAAFGDSPLGG